MERAVWQRSKVKQLHVSAVTLTLALTLTLCFLRSQPAHGKRSGTVTAEGLPDDGSEAVAAIGVPEDTRWLLSKLVRQVEPGSRGKMWQRLAGASVPSVGDRRHREVQWKNSPGDEDAERAIENEVLSR